MEVEDDQDITGAGGDSNSSGWRKSKISKSEQDEVEVLAGLNGSVDSAEYYDDDDELEILESTFPPSVEKLQPHVVKNPLHTNKQPEFIDLTNEEDQDMVSEFDDSDVIVEEDMPEVNDVVEEDDDTPQLVDVPPVSKTEVADGHRKVGNHHFQLTEYNQALAAYNRAIELVPTEASYYGNRAACLMMMKRFVEALTDSQLSLKLDPSYEKSYLRIVRVNLALGDVAACETAIQQYDTLRAATTNISPEKRKLQDLKKFLIDMASSTNRKDFRRVLFLCDRVLEIANAAMDIRIRKGYTLSKLGRHSEAAEVAADIMNIDQHNVDAHVIRGICHYQLDNMDKSLSFFRGALQRSPDAAEPKVLYKQVKQIKEHREIATNFYKEGKYDESKALYLECVKLVTTDDDLQNTCLESKFYFNLSLIYNKQRMYDDALQFVSKAIDINPSYYKAFVHRATIHNAKELYEEAARDLEAALKLDPSKRELRNDIQNAKMFAKRAKRKDYYKILDISKGASEDDIRKAYKKRALLHHPDRHAGATESVQKEQEKNFKDVGEAYEVLSDPKKRFRYDQGHDLTEAGHSGGSAYYDPYEANQLFNMFFSTGGNAGHGGRGSSARFYNSSGRSGPGGCSYGFQR